MAKAVIRFPFLAQKADKMSELDITINSTNQEFSNPRRRKVASHSSTLKYARTDSEAVMCPCGINVRAHKRSCPLNPSHRGKCSQVKPSDDSGVEVTEESETNPVLVTGPLPSEE